MTHSDYMELRAEGLVHIGINPSVALNLIKHLPKRYQYAHSFWGWVMLLSIPGALALWLFIAWYWALASLFILTPVLNASLRKSARQFVIEHATENPEFFDALVGQGLITVVNKN